MRRLPIVGASLIAMALPSAAYAQDRDPQTDIVVTGSRLPGPVIDSDRLPLSSQTIDSAAIDREGSPDLLGALSRDLAGVTFADAQDNPYQPDLYYRGYEASALGGDAQGLAVYLDGARFNQPFGDTVNWDLIPDIAIRRLTLESANPAFGLNAIGGAVAIDLKSGRDLSGLGGDLATGAFGAREASAEGGGKSGRWSFYLAGSARHDDGWRDFSPSTLHQLYADLGFDARWGTVDLKLVWADTSLTGNGASPVELLAARPASVFTWPDNSRNRYARAQLAATADLGRGITLRPQAYLTTYRQRTVNGDLSDAAPCDGDGSLLCLEGDHGELLTTTAGPAFAAFLGNATYAQLNRTRTQTTGYGASFQVDAASRAHRWAVGGSWDGSRTLFDAQSLLGALTADRGFADAQGTIDMVDGPIRPVAVRTRRNDVGVYAGDVVAIGTRFDLSLSARFDSSRVTLRDQLGAALNGKHDYARLNPAIGGVWRPAKGITLYAGYAESNRAPTPAELSCADPGAPCSLSAFFVGDPELKQVVARTWEAGLRGTTRAGGFAVEWRIGAWRATNSDDIVFAASATRGRAYFRNVGQTRRQGIEATFAAHNRHWDIALAYTLTDATYRTPFVVASPDNPAADADGTISVAAGDRLPSVPRHLAKLGVVRRFGGSSSLSLSGQCASGRWLLGDEANLTRPTAAYCVADAAGSVALLKGISLFAQIRNLFDRRYATFGTFSEVAAVSLAEAPGASDSRSLSPAAPRTWRVGLRLRY